jgi:hypothetical protein
MLFGALTAALAQDPFEIHIYEYETLAPGGYTLEAHLNYVLQGTKVSEGPLVPSQHQFHMTYELTRGITKETSLGFMFLTAARPDGSGLEYAGVRLLPHLYAPESWKLPVKLGLVCELSFQRTTYEENARRVEIRPILERTFGRWQVDLNPVFERALHGPGTNDGWQFEPAGRVGYQLSKRFTPSLEYYSALGPLPGLSPLPRQFHQLLPGGDWKLGEDFIWSFGIGAGLTSAEPHLVLKSRFEFGFGRKGS